MTALMILAVFFPALAGVLVWLLPAAKEDRALRAKLNCGALALELVMVIALCTAQGTEALLLNMTPSLALYMRMDVLGSVFAVLMSAMWLVGSVYACHSGRSHGPLGHQGQPGGAEEHPAPCRYPELHGKADEG